MVEFAFYFMISSSMIKEKLNDRNKRIILLNMSGVNSNNEKIYFQVFDQLSQD